VTSSTASLSDTEDSCSSDCSEELLLGERRVSFLDEIVTEVRTRPYTPRDEISNLYYTTEETDVFRQDYYFERRLRSNLASSFDGDDNEDDDLFEDDDYTELSAMISEANTKNSSSSCCHRISRVVVMHNSKCETFLNPEEMPPSNPNCQFQGEDNFFDSDSFWSGSIAWY